MNIEICDSYESMSLKAKELICSELLQNRKLLFCAATGGSPTRMYQLLSEEYDIHPELFSTFRVIKLDEWGGLTMNNEGTCESYLKQHLIEPLHITENRYISWNSTPNNPQNECERIADKLKKEGPIDICILGIGVNGHLALNEPAEKLQANCHVAQLAATSLQHPMLSPDEEKPIYGLTLGMADIMQSKLIILLINGAKKRAITQAFLQAEISTQLPASLLWLHPNVVCLMDKEAANKE